MLVRWRRRLYRLGLAVGGLLFLYQIWSGYQALYQKTLQIVSPVMLVVGWGLVVVAFGIQITAWGLVTGWLGGALTWKQVVRGYSISFLPRYIPGSVWGYLSRGQWFYSYYNVPFAVTSVSSILEVLGILVAASLAISIYWVSLSNDIVQYLLFLFFVILPFVTWRLLPRLLRFSVLKRLPGELPDGSGLFGMSFGNWIVVVGMYVAMWLCYGGFIRSVINSFGVTQEFGLIVNVYMFSASWLYGFFVLLVPSGLGIREIALSGLIMAYLSMTSDQSMAISVMSRLFVSLAEFFWVVLSISFLRR